MSEEYVEVRRSDLERILQELVEIRSGLTGTASAAKKRPDKILQLLDPPRDIVLGIES